MSTETNQELFDRAEQMVTYFEGKMPALLIEKDMETNDLEQLLIHVSGAEAVAAQQEMEASDVV